MLAAKLVAIVESQRQLGGSAYPVPVRRLVELAAEPSKSVSAALKAAEKNGALYVSLKLTGKQAAVREPHAVVFIPRDPPDVEALLHAALRVSRSAAAGAFDAKQLASTLSPALAKDFTAALGRIGADRTVPPGIGSVLHGKAKRLFFLLEDAQLAASRPAEPHLAEAPPKSPQIEAPTRHDGNDFAARFATAFQDLDRAKGSRNYVLLHDLRRALSGISRHDFDTGLNALRRAKRFSLDASDGRHDRLTEEQLAAGIVEAGNVLVYVQRREP